MRNRRMLVKSWAVEEMMMMKSRRSRLVVDQAEIEVGREVDRDSGRSSPAVGKQSPANHETTVP